MIFPILSEYARVISGQELEEMLPYRFRKKVVENTQSQESKEYHLNKAEEKRKSKAEKRRNKT